MKKISFQVLIALIILGSAACISRKAIQLINLTTRELPSQIEIILTTTVLKAGDIVYVPKTLIADAERFLRDMASPITWYFRYVRY